MNTEETQRKRKQGKKLQFENTILTFSIFMAFMNIFMNMAFTILATFQNIVITTLSNLRP